MPIPNPNQETYAWRMMFRQCETTRPHALRASSQRWYDELVRKTRSLVRVRVRVRVRVKGRGRGRGRWRVGIRGRIRVRIRVRVRIRARAPHQPQGRARDREDGDGQLQPQVLWRREQRGLQHVVQAVVAEGGGVPDDDE